MLTGRGWSHIFYQNTEKKNANTLILWKNKSIQGGVPVLQAAKVTLWVSKIDRSNVPSSLWSFKRA